MRLPAIQSPHPDIILSLVRRPSPRANTLRESPREAERRLGRAAAYKALRDLGLHSPPPVLSGERGMPLWPDGTVGSISHSEDLAIAAVARSDRFRSIGIDLERLRPLSIDISKRICGPDEFIWCGKEADIRLRRTLLLFSAKESIYKALYPLVRRYFGFRAVVLTWDDSAQNFLAMLLEDLAMDFPRGTEFRVQVQEIAPDLIFASTVLPR